MVKKIVILWLAAALLFCTACGEEGRGNDGEEKADSGRKIQTRIGRK